MAYHVDIQTHSNWYNDGFYLYDILNLLLKHSETPAAPYEQNLQNFYPQNDESRIGFRRQPHCVPCVSRVKVFVLPSSTTTCPWLLLWALRCQQRSIRPLPVGPKQAPWWTMMSMAEHRPKSQGIANDKITHILRTINDSYTTIDNPLLWQSRAA